MTKHLNGQIAEACASPEALRAQRWGRLQADIALFVEGGFINWELMKWLDPHKFEHWTLKSVRPRPSLRVFGRFAQPDVFVGTHVVERTPLKRKWSIEWELQKLICEERWKEVLGVQAPFHAEHYEDYITEKAAKQLKVLS